MAGSIAPLSGVARTAIAGIQSAGARIDRAAQTVAETGARASDTVSITSGAEDAHDTDEATALIDMRMAKYQLAAQVRVLQTADDATKDILEIGKR